MDSFDLCCNVVMFNPSSLSPSRQSNIVFSDWLAGPSWQFWSRLPRLARRLWMMRSENQLRGSIWLQSLGLISRNWFLHSWLLQLPDRRRQQSEFRCCWQLSYVIKAQLKARKMTPRKMWISEKRSISDITVTWKEGRIPRYQAHHPLLFTSQSVSQSVSLGWLGVIF